MNGKHYTQNWNQQFIQNTKGLGKFDLAMEIGCFEGLTSNYIVDNLLTENGKLICIDPLADGYTKQMPMQPVFKNQYDRFMYNVDEHIKNGKIILSLEESQKALEQKLIQTAYDITSHLDIISNLFYRQIFGNIDFIYIDGDHTPDMVYLDGVNSFRYAKVGGIILFDDYNWGDVHNAGIDRFLEEYAGKYELILKDYQVMIKKTNQ